MAFELQNDMASVCWLFFEKREVGNENDVILEYGASR
jgi:hypothetical protein